MNSIIKLKHKCYFSFLLILSFNLTFTGIIQPDDILPLEISPTYTNEIGSLGTIFTFRFYIPNIYDKDNMPTARGYGASHGQFIGISFNQISATFQHTCSLIQTDNNLNIPVIPLNSEDEPKTIYCKINSIDNTKMLFPGYNYKLIIKMISGTASGTFNSLFSITLFTSTSNSTSGEIIDSGTFNHINIFPAHNPNSPQNPIAVLDPTNTNLNVEVETNFNFEVKITFRGWFSWDDYVICINLPKNQVNVENPEMTLSRPPSSSIEVPVGIINSINLESNEERKYIGFYMDGSLTENREGEILLMNFSGFKTKESGLINDDDSTNNNYIGIEIRYRNSYAICASKNINFQVSLGNVKFTVKHPESIIREDGQNYIFDVFRGGAFQIEFNINTPKSVNNKYFLIRQKDSKQFQRVTFIASSCDFSSFNISSSNFNELPKCFPIKNKNKNEGTAEDNYNGIFFYYPYVMKADTDYKLRVWMFFDECGPEDTETTGLGVDRSKVEIQFYLEMYNNINKEKIGEKRIESKYIFMEKIPTENSIVCYNTYMGDKNYNNGYLFNYNSYIGTGKLLYREYFNWNIYDYDSDDGQAILQNLYEEKTPKFIYSEKTANKLNEGTKILLVNKITQDSGNNEKLGQFFPMGLFKNAIGGNLVAIEGKFFMRLSRNFFAQQKDSNGNAEKCSVSWGFGSPSIKETQNWKPEPKSYPKQKYNFITNSDTFFDDPTALYKAHITDIKDYSLESDKNDGWEENQNKAEWAFGDDETLEDQISDDSPVDVYFGLADTCHHWTKLDQTITSLYTPIEIIIGVTGETSGYSRVMRFVKLFPEGGVWHDNTISASNNDIFIRSNDFIFKNHYAFNVDETDENDGDEKGVCLLEVLPGILDSQRAKSSNFFLWIFLGSLLDTDYDQISSTYPIGNLPDSAKAYGYSSQHSLHIKNFYASPSNSQRSDINSPIYTLAMSMNSIYQTATSGYLFYLGSLIVFYNKVKSNSMYDLSNDPLLIPYYCPYYISKAIEDPFSLGIFPSFIAGFGSFESMTNFGNKGFEKLVAQKINNIQLNVLMLSGVKIVHNNNIGLEHFYNTVKFINNYSTNLMTLDVWNSREDNDNNLAKEYDSIDAFIFFFNEKITALNSVSPEPYIPNQLKTLVKSRKGNYCFYVYGKKFCTGLYGVANSDILLTRNSPSSKDNTPYLSINLKFEISQDLLRCESSPDEFCPTNLIGFWGISSNHDMIQYVTNYNTDSFLVDYNIYRTYINNNPPTFELGQTMAFQDDPAIFIKIVFNSPFRTPILSNTILSFKIKDITNARCSVQSHDVDLPSMNCYTNTDTSSADPGLIQCQLVDSSMKYNIFCYELNYGTNGLFKFNSFKLNLPNETPYPGLGTLIFEDTNEYTVNIINSDLSKVNSEIQATYITSPHNEKSYSKVEFRIDLKRPAHPGMEIEIRSDMTNNFVQNSECKLSLSKIEAFSMSDIDMDSYWTIGNSLVKNCEITRVTSEFIIKAKLDDKIYKAEKILSNIVYIYIWPFKTTVLEHNQYAYLTVKVNGNNIIQTEDTVNNKIYFSSISQNVDQKECMDISGLLTITRLSSNIIGDLSDYTFKFNFNSASVPYSASTFKPLSFAQVFFPKEINFECEECVKCYQVSSSGTTTTTAMINCNFADYNILNIFFSREITSGNHPDLSILVTGIINPKTTPASNPNFFLNLINIDSYGERLAIFSSTGSYSSGLDYIPNPKIGSLKFVYYIQAISDHNPRKKAAYIFRFGFDYANYGYTSSSLPVLSSGSLLHIYFPRDYHLYINDNPTETQIFYKYVDNTETSFSRDSKILGRKIEIELQATSSSAKLKYIEVRLNNIKNPSKIISTTENLVQNKYTGYFKIVCLNNPSSVQSSSAQQYYYVTGINSNTYRSDYITNENLRTNEFNWYRGNLIETDTANKDKLIIDILYNQKTYNVLFLQPGRYTKVHFVTSSDNEDKLNFYLKASSNRINFPSNSIVKTIEDSYVVPSLYGEPYEFYIGVPCTTNEGIYSVTPEISNTDEYIEAPTIIINVRQIETAKVDFNINNVGISPLNAKTRVYYYLSDINVDDLTIGWNKNFNDNFYPKKIIDFDNIVIPQKTVTDINKEISNVFSTLNVKLKTGESEPAPSNTYNFKSANINRCYELTKKEISIREYASYNFLNYNSYTGYKLTDDLVIKNSGNDANLKSNEIKFEFSPPIYQPSFILCELFCQYKTGDDESKLKFLNFDSMNTYLNTVKQNYFRKYSSNYFSSSISTGSLIYSNVIKGYQYNAQCIYQTTQSDSSLIEYRVYPLTSQNLHSTYPPKTRCNTFYFISPIKEEIQQKYINYCQYVIGKNLGYENGGCVICSDSSGKIVPPGYSLYFPFSCQNEQCYDKSNSDLIDEMYNLAEEFNTKSKGSKYEFTICATSNRICSSQITEEQFNSAFNQFVNDVKTTENVNQLFNIDYTDINYIIYNGNYQNMIYVEDNINENDVSINFISELSSDGSAIWRASYNSQVNFNILCFWRIKISTDTKPTLEQMTNCFENDAYCGVFVANYGGHEYKIPDNKKKDVVVGEYTMYIACSHFVPSPVYYTSVKAINTMEINEVSFSEKIKTKNIIGLLLLILLI